MLFFKKKAQDHSEAIIEGLKSSNVRVFEDAANQLYKMCFVPIVEHLVANGSSAEQAEEVFNEVIAEIFIPSVIADNYRHEGKMLAFIKKVCQNKCLDLMRKEKGMTNIIPLHDLNKTANEQDDNDHAIDEEMSDWDIEAKDDDNTIESVVLDTLDSLPQALDLLGQTHPIHRDFILKYWWQKQDIAEIARELNIPVGQENVFHKRAKDKLKKILVNLTTPTSSKNNPFGRVA